MGRLRSDRAIARSNKIILSGAGGICINNSPWPLRHEARAGGDEDGSTYPAETDNVRKINNINILLSLTFVRRQTKPTTPRLISEGAFNA
jgi:hypothetical protein